MKYVIVERAHPVNREAPRKFYAVAKSTGDVNLKKLSKEIAETSTVNDTDVLAVLNDLTKMLSKHLELGHIVRLGDFGTFQLSLSSEGCESEAKFTSAYIKGAKIHFKPGEDIQKTLRSLKYEKAK